MWTQCKGDGCKYCEKGETKISSSLVMPNTNNNGVYLHNLSYVKGGETLPLVSDKIIPIN